MKKEIRFGEFVRAVSVRQHHISMNALAEPSNNEQKNERAHNKNARVHLTRRDIYRILAPYITTRFLDQAKAVIPLALYLMLFQIFILQQNVVDTGIICGGLLAVMIGLMLFMEGLRLGLMPFGETIGNLLPVKSPLPMVLGIAFLLGVGVTFAEPAIGALKAAGSIVEVKNAPILYAMLNHYADALVLMIGIGVGLAAILGTLRFVYDWSLKPLIYLSLVPVLWLTAYVGFFKPEVAKVIGLAWDCGAVTTGPVTVPLVLSLGIGVAAAVGRGNNSLSGFGIVTLASLFPILGALLLGLYISFDTTPDAIIQAAQDVTTVTILPWYEQTPWLEVMLAVRAIVPLVLFLLLVMAVLLKEKIQNAGFITYGIVLAVIGMGLFNVGLTYGLSKLGDQSGSLVPAAFTNLLGIPHSPLYWYEAGVAIALAFAFFLGLRATLAEPALNVLGMTVENLTQGAFRKTTLMYAVSVGVGIGIMLGVCKLIFNWQLVYMLLPGYLLLLVLTYVSTEAFVNVAWDSAGVTTGPVTVPLVLAMGLGFGNATGVIEGFGILSMASLCPIVSVLCTGLFVHWQAKKSGAPEEIANEDLSTLSTQ